MSTISYIKGLGVQFKRSTVNLYRALPRDRKELAAVITEKAHLLHEAGAKKVIWEFFSTAYKLLEAGKDLAMLLSPKFMATKGGRYAFLVHPRDITDIYRPYPFFKYLPNSLVMEIAKFLPPITLSRIEGVKQEQSGENIRGYLLSTVLTPQHMLEDPQFAVRRTVQMAMLADKKGIALVGLGALNPSLTKYGTIIKKYVPQIGVTTGHAYTSHVIAMTALRVKELLYRGKDEPIAIVGAAGSTGSASAWALFRSGIQKFVLIDQEKKKLNLEALKEELFKANPRLEITTSTNLADIKHARIIITVTNASKSIISEELLLPGMIFIDDAQPSNVSEELAAKRQDIRVLKVLAESPGLNPNFDFGLGTSPAITFTCLAETAILAAHKKTSDFTVGYVHRNQLHKIAILAKRNKVALPSVFYTFGGREVTEKEIKVVGRLWKSP